MHFLHRQSQCRASFSHLHVKNCRDHNGHRIETVIDASLAVATAIFLTRCGCLGHPNRLDEALGCRHGIYRQTAGPAITPQGEVPEWLNGAVSKTVVGASPPRVRIPLSPPFNKYRIESNLIIELPIVPLTVSFWGISVGASLPTDCSAVPGCICCLKPCRYLLQLISASPQVRAC